MYNYIDKVFELEENGFNHGTHVVKTFEEAKNLSKEIWDRFKVYRPKSAKIKLLKLPKSKLKKRTKENEYIFSMILRRAVLLHYSRCFPRGNLLINVVITDKDYEHLKEIGFYNHPFVEKIVDNKLNEGVGHLIKIESNPEIKDYMECFCWLKVDVLNQYVDLEKCLKDYYIFNYSERKYNNLLFYHNFISDKYHQEEKDFFNSLRS